MSKNEKELTELSEQVEEKQLVNSEEGLYYAPTSLKAQFLNASAEFISSIQDDGTIETKSLIYNSMNNNDGAIKKIAKDKGFIEVKDFMIYPVDIVHDSGELIPAFRTVLITPEGKSYGSVATGVFKSLKNIVAVVGMPNTWGKPLKIAPIEVETRRGFTTIQLVIVTQ